MDEDMRICFETNLPFPVKLYEVADDGMLVQWTNSGDGIVIEEYEFEDHVMEFYPGFLQIASFHNFRRILREYHFAYTVLRQRQRNPNGMRLEYKQPNFVRDRPDLLQRIVPKKRNKINGRLAARKRGCYRKTWKSFNESTYYRRFKKQSWDSVCEISFSEESVPVNRMKACNGFESWVTKRIFSPCQEVEDTPVRKCINVISRKQPKNSFLIDTRRMKGVSSNRNWRSRNPASFKSLLDKSQSSTANEAEALDHDSLMKLSHLYASKEMTFGEFWEFLLKNSNMNTTMVKNISWEETMQIVDALVFPGLSPFHHPDSYEFSFDEL